MYPKISIIIPVYNGEKCLVECVNSVRQQTLRDIEIVCVDDCSQDASRQMLCKMAEEDARIKLCFHDRNSSVFVARKTGVAAATGEYILFLDSDDYLELSACEALYNKAVKENVDILHFCTQIVDCGIENETQKKEIKKLLLPYSGRLTGNDVFSKGFVKRKIWGNLVNKLYRSEVCKEAYAQLQDAYFAVAEDILVFCAIAYYAKSYLGWNSKPLYYYKVGDGISTGGTISLAKFERQCVMANVNRTMTTFCMDRGVYDIAKDLIEQLGAIWLNHCCESWYDKLTKDQAAEGWSMLCKHWGAERAIAHIVKMHDSDRKEIACKLERLPSASLRGKTIKTVGIYYHRLYNGGVERVISILAPLFQNIGYQVVVITDELPKEEDFPLPKEVIRETIYSNLNTNPHNIGVRFATWSQIVKKHSVDVVIYNAWLSDLLLWDMLYLKETGVPVVVHAHGVFSCTIVEMKEVFAELPNVLHLADGIVTLSEVDKRFWSLFCQNVHCIPNPAAEPLTNAKAACWENQTVIWVGRANPEKQPEKLFDIMRLVVDQFPNAKLLVLGDFGNPKWERIVKRKKLENNVVFCGLVSNVSAYLERASVFVCTSQFEGFPMSLVEAQAHSLPAVMFRLPHVMMATSDRGVVSVDMNDVTSAADEVVRFLRDEAHWNAYSEMAYQSYTWLRDYDLCSAWHRLLSGEVESYVCNEDVRKMMNTLLAHYTLACQNRENVNAVTWVLQKIGGGIQCCQENGLGYTTGLAIRKIQRRFQK